MTVIKSEFYLALNQVATERGISPEDVLESIKAAVLAAYKKDYEHPEEEEEELDVKLNKNTGEMHIMHKDKDITPPGFGRIAAQTARQVILQKIREAEKKTIIEQYSKQIGTLVKGRVIRFDGKTATLDIGKAEGILPPSEQIKKDSYKVNDSYMLYIVEISEDNFGNSRIIVSRNHPKLVEELFKKEVPEIANETVKVQNVVREAGERTKIAVFSRQPGIDPVGACVGQKGIRVKSVTDELGGEEKIDIIQYNEDNAIYIREALSPATVIGVEIDEEVKRAKVSVDEQQAPLAIGKGGVNVNLASRLSGYEIDIVQVEVKQDKTDQEEDKKKSDQKQEKPENETKEQKKKSDKKEKIKELPKKEDDDKKNQKKDEKEEEKQELVQQKSVEIEEEKEKKEDEETKDSDTQDSK